MSFFPDWRDESSYPRTLSIREWRWQFVRRHPDYQSRFDSSNQVIYIIHGAHTHVRNHGRSKPPLGSLEIQRSRDETCEILDVRGDDTEEIQNSFGMNYLVDWRIEVLPKTIDRTDRHEGVWLKNSGNLTSIPLSGKPEDEDRYIGELGDPIQYVEVDLRFDVDDQIERSRQILKSIQRELGYTASRDYRDHSYNWPTYLRILDARKQNPPVSFREIGEILAPNQLRSANAAQKLQDQAIKVQDRLTFVRRSNDH